MRHRLRDQLNRHPRAIAAGIVGATMVLLVVVVGLAIAGFGADPTAEASPVPSASANLSVNPSASPSSSAMPSSTAPPSPTGGGELVVPSFVSVTAERLQVRQEPGLTGEPLMDHMSCIDNPDPNCARPVLIGTESGLVDLYLLDGPVEADGYVWYLASTDEPGVLGWVASGDENDAWLVAAPRSCPSQPLELADVIIPAISRVELLHCFGRQRLTFRGWFPDLGSGFEIPYDTDGSCFAEPAFLMCGPWNKDIRPIEMSFFDPRNTQRLNFTVDPAAGIELPERMQWIEITGAFDHPASQQCGPEPGGILNCRVVFVATEISVSN
jgi:hypothetical protein